MDKQKKTKFEIAVIKKVVEMRNKKGFSQDDIATALELTRGFIGQIESPNSASKYNLNHLNRLAYEMGCKPKDFIPDNFIAEDDWD